jgi:hypothetical protein
LRRWAISSIVVVFTFTSAGVAWAGETRTVRLDLDLDELGLTGSGDAEVVLEIHCAGAVPAHRVTMDGDVLVVRTRRAMTSGAPPHDTGGALLQ